MKKKLKPGEEPVQLGKAEYIESTKTIHEANGDITDHVSYRRPPHMEIYGTVPAFRGGWSSDKARRKKQIENDKYWAKKRKAEKKRSAVRKKVGRDI